MHESSQATGSIDEIIDDYLGKLRAGERPSVMSYQIAHPELADEIADLFPLVAAMEGWKEQETDARGGRNSLGGVQIERLGDFQIVREIGRGGMGIVFEAIQISLQRRVAIKVLPPLEKQGDKAGERFRREAQTAASLHHSNIVPVFGIGYENGFSYIVMQLIDGCGLDTMLKANANLSTQPLRLDRTEPILRNDEPFLSNAVVKPFASHLRGLEVRLVAKLGIQAAEALQHAHEAGTLHRDIKPANLLLDRKGKLWVADFGLAKALEHHALSRSGDIVGTLMYMAPERLKGICDARSDVYSLGITLLELALGKNVFDLSDSGSLIERILKGYHSGRDLELDHISLDLRTVLLKAISVEPRDRYQTAAEFAEDLTAFVEDRPIRARQPTRLEQVMRTCRRNPLVASLSASILLLLFSTVCITTFGWFQQRKMRNRTEAILETTLSSFDKIYANYAGDGDGAAESLLSSVVLSDEAAEMLVGLLAVYDELASQGGDTQALSREALNARLRVAEIQSRLGQFEQAAENFEDAIFSMRDATYRTDQERFEWNVRHARALINLSLVKEYAADESGCSEIRERATRLLRLCQSIRPDNDEVLLSLARVYYLEGRQFRIPSVIDGQPLQKFPRPNPARRPPDPSILRERGAFEGPQGPPPPHDRGRFGAPWLGPPQGRPEFVAKSDGDADRSSKLVSGDRDARLSSLHTALEYLDRVDQHSRLDRSQLLRALVLREIAGLGSDGSHVQASTLQQSIGLLEDLVSRGPANATECPLQLARTLIVACEQSEIGSPENTQESVRYLNRAVELLQGLHRQQPQIPEYSSTLAQVSERLALKLMELADHPFAEDRGENIERAESMLQSAIEMQQTLVNRYENRTVERLWLIRFKISYAFVTSGRRDRRGNEKEIEQIRRELAEIELTEDELPMREKLLVQLMAIPDIRPPRPDFQRGRDPK